MIFDFSYVVRWAMMDAWIHFRSHPPAPRRLFRKATHMTHPLVFIDGDQGTTGLQIHERLRGRTDLRLLPPVSYTHLDVYKSQPMPCPRVV